MSVAVQVPEEVAERLRVEAARRGVSIEAVAADVLGRNLPTSRAHRLRFVGVGASGKAGPLDLATERRDLAARILAAGI